jgi:RNA-directed DNA polymerase
MNVDAKALDYQRTSYIRHGAFYMYYEKIYDFDNLYRAFRLARRGKRWKTATAKFEVNLLETYIPDKDVWWLLEYIIDSTDSPGIPIGNQSSQLFAILALSPLDHFIKERLGIKYYGRYMDDFYLIHHDKEYLKQCKKDIAMFLAPTGMELNEKTQIFPLKNGIDFLGFHIYLTETGKTIWKIRRVSKNNMSRKLKKFRKLLDKGLITKESIHQSYQSWRGHALRGNCYHLVKQMDDLYKELFEEVNKDGSNSIESTNRGES